MDLPTLLLNPKALFFLFGGLFPIWSDSLSYGEDHPETTIFEAYISYLPQPGSGSEIRVEVYNWDFNEPRNYRDWTTGSNVDNNRWIVAPDGTLAFTEWEEICTDWFLFWCTEREWYDTNYYFHSNDNSPFFLVNSYVGSGNFNDLTLISPNFSTLGKTSIELSFWHHYKDKGSNDRGYVEYSIDGGKSWEAEKISFTTNQGEHDGFSQTTVPLPQKAENKGEVKIRFRYDGTDGDWYWAVDNVKITGVSAPDTPTEPNDPDNPENPGGSDGDCENVQIMANFCAGTAEERMIELTSFYEYDSYRWYDTYDNPVPIDKGGHSQTIRTNLAGTYTLEVRNENGCYGKKTITTAEELVENGNFEAIYDSSFETDYIYVPDYNGNGNALGPEGTYSINRDANNYHSAFFGKDHTTGDGKFLMVNGATDNNKVIWKKTIENIQPNTDYYFSAWGMNLNPSEPAELQFKLNGKLIGIAADLSNADKPTDQNQVNRGNWKQFYMPSWNSGKATEVTLEIVNNNNAAGGNDFGIDDISFGNLDPISFKIEPPKDLTVCHGHTLRLYSNIHGGRSPVTYTWTKNGEVISHEKNPVIENAKASDAGTYHLSVTDFYGCEPVTASTKVNVDDHCHNLNFDGVDDYSIFGDAYNFEGSFTLEAWVKPNSLVGTRSILSKTDAEKLTEGGYALIIESGKVGFLAKNSKIIYTGGEITTNRWYHVAASFDKNSKLVKIYVDGIKLREGNVNGGIASTGTPFLIGGMYNSDTPWNPSHYFDGFIEEVRIWNRTLTTEQIQFMMNQRLEKNAAGKVTGQVLPMEVPGEIPWNDLKGYYPLLASDVEHNEEEHDENHGITKDEAEEKTRGFLMNMQDDQENTAPLPYILYVQNGDWWDKSTWTLPEVLDGKEISQRDVLDPPNSEGIDLSTRINWNIVGISSYIKSDSNITLLGLLSNNGNLDMEGSIPLSESSKPINESGSELKITQYLWLDGVIDLNGESQLIQTPGSILAPESSGKVERDQQGTASSYNYNYWSSPVSTEVRNIEGENVRGYTVGAVLNDGSDPDEPKEINFGSSHTHADSGNSTPVKISTYWINKFFGVAGSYSQWKHVGKDGFLTAGEGFTMKGSRNVHVNSGLQQNYIFMGLPNNGNINLEVGTNTNYLIGNPYPSALDADEFIKDNLQIRRDKNVFNGSLYFWSHFSGKTHNLQEYVGGYATYNLSGGVQAVANDSRINNNKNKGGKIPQRYIPIGQAFFVNTVLDEKITNWENPDQAPTLIEGGEIRFKNSQRAFKTEILDAETESVFHGPEEKTTKITNGDVDKRKKIWLEFHSPDGFHRQILVTADPETSQDFDLGYDAPLNDNVSEDMYWLLHDLEFVIQGVPHFNLDQELPFGIKIAKDSTFTIALDQVENISEGMDIFVKDSLQDTYHNLRKEPFKLAVAPGLIHGRFSLVFRDPNDIPPEEENPTGNEDGGNEEEHGGKEEKDEVSDLWQMDVVYSQSNRTLTVNNPEMRKIFRVRLINGLGQQMQEYLNLPLQEKLEIPIKRFAKGIYIVKIDCGQEMTEKILIE